MTGCITLLLLTAFGFAEPAGLKPTPSRIIAGNAFTSTGQPADGATVVWMLGTEPGQPTHHVIRATTDTRGQFTLEVPEARAPHVLNPQPSMCWVHHREHGVSLFIANDAEIAPGEPPFFKCTLNRPDQQIQIRLVDREGLPAAGELVEIAEVEASEGRCIVPYAIRELIAVVTDEDGRAILPYKADIWTALSLRVVSERFGRQEFSPRISLEKVNTLELSPTARLSGKIERRDGAKTADIAVYLLPGGRAPELLRRLAALREQNVSPASAGMPSVITDSNGRFDFGAIPAGQYMIRAMATGRGDVIATPPQSVQLAAGEDKSVTLAPAPTIAVDGRIRFSAGPPVEGAIVRLVQQDQSGYGSAIPDEEGRFTARVLAGKLEAQVMCYDPRTQSPAMVAAWSEPVVIAPTDAGRQLPELSIADRNFHAGRVVDRDGAPVRRKRIIASEQGLIRATGRTDDDGRFWLTKELPLMTDISFEVRVEGHYRTTKKQSASPLELVLD